MAWIYCWWYIMVMKQNFDANKPKLNEWNVLFFLHFYNALDLNNQKILCLPSFFQFERTEHNVSHPNEHLTYVTWCGYEGIKKSLRGFSNMTWLEWQLWQYGLWSFKTGGTKLERFLPKNQHAHRKLLIFENWVNGEV